MENTQQKQINPLLLGSVYIYLLAPVVIFIIGWLKLYFAIPIVLIILASVFFSVKNHLPELSRFRNPSYAEWGKILIIVTIIFVWVVMSGVGGYTWQNSDHITRNSIFRTMVEDKWPLLTDREGVTNRAVIYYIGFWFPAALVGKIGGLEAGYNFLAIWTGIGIAIFYGIICSYRKKIEVWPLVLIVFFSGMDAVSHYLFGYGALTLWGADHLEANNFYQFSSMTTQLFWVYNQAVPAWVAVAFMMLYEKPKNIMFTWLSMLLNSCFPFVGMLPYVIYIIFVRGDWKPETRTFKEALQKLVKNVFTVQNLAGATVIGIIVSLYLLGNDALYDAVGASLEAVGKPVIGAIVVVAIAAMFVMMAAGAYLVWKGKGNIINIALVIIGIGVIIWRSAVKADIFYRNTPYIMADLVIFWIAEAGAFLACLYFTKGVITDKKSFYLWELTLASLAILPMFSIGNSCDFCMRATIPALIVLMFGCIKAFSVYDEHRKEAKTSEEKAIADGNFAEARVHAKSRKMQPALIVLVILLAIGAITPLHEFARTYTFSRLDYEILYDADTIAYDGYNFGGYETGVFWEYMVK